MYDIIHFYQRGNTMAVAIFFIVGFLTSFFSKNMIVIIVSAIAVSHIVVYGNKMSEGFEEGVEEEEVEEEPVEEEKKEEEEEPVEEEEKETFKESEKSSNSSNDLINDMNNLLKRTEKLIESSNQQGFSGMNNNYATYK